MVSQRTRGIDNNLNWYTASLLLDRSGGGVCNREWSRPGASPQARRFGWPHIWYRWGMLRRADHGSPCSQGFHPDAGASLHPFQYHTSVGPHHVGGATSHTSSAHCRGPPSLLVGINLAGIVAAPLGGMHGGNLRTWFSPRGTALPEQTDEQGTR